MTEQGHRVTGLRLVVTATDHGAAVRFLRDVRGLPEQEAREADGGPVVLDAGRATPEINDPRHAEYRHAEYIDEVEVGHRVPARIRVAFEVPDPGATTADLVGAGAAPVGTAAPDRLRSRGGAAVASRAQRRRLASWHRTGAAPARRGVVRPGRRRRGRGPAIRGSAVPEHGRLAR
ncbi:hypothetical protein ACI8AK_13500 [Geodermatophilus sp. SYSU D00867]